MYRSNERITVTSHVEIFLSPFRMQPMLDNKIDSFEDMCVLDFQPNEILTGAYTCTYECVVAPHVCHIWLCVFRLFDNVRCMCD